MHNTTRFKSPYTSVAVAAWQGGPGGPWTPQHPKFLQKGGAKIPKCEKKFELSFEAFPPFLFVCVPVTLVYPLRLKTDFLRGKKNHCQTSHFEGKNPFLEFLRYKPPSSETFWALFPVSFLKTPHLLRVIYGIISRPFFTHAHHLKLFRVPFQVPFLQAPIL